MLSECIYTSGGGGFQLLDVENYDNTDISQAESTKTLNVDMSGTCRILACTVYANAGSTITLNGTTLTPTKRQIANSYYYYDYFEFSVSSGDVITRTKSNGTGLHILATLSST